MPLTKKQLNILCAYLLTSTVLLSCSSVNPSEDYDSITASLSFLAVGETTKVHLLQRLGQPSSTYENDEVWIYRIQYDQTTDKIKPAYGQFPIWNSYQLVLLFDPSGFLSEYNLIGAGDDP
ncbi:hypothetical protein QP938_13105 [Porticoccaceae bacterium LTM1]|nr:hypothetical protein QP938_13105 [Porticoccaceae bacterium LTM1]